MLACFACGPHCCPQAKKLLPVNYRPTPPIDIFAETENAVEAWNSACNAAIRAGVSTRIVSQVTRAVQKVCLWCMPSSGLCMLCNQTFDGMCPFPIRMTTAGMVLVPL